MGRSLTLARIDHATFLPILKKALWVTNVRISHYREWCVMAIKRGCCQDRDRETKLEGAKTELPFFFARCMDDTFCGFVNFSCSPLVTTVLKFTRPAS